MRRLWSAVLYTGVMLGANPAMADRAAIEALRAGDMLKLAVIDPIPVPDATLVDESDAPHSLAEYKGKVVLLNFWATWCAPCRKEMPALDRLQGELGGDDFAVVTVATGRNGVPAMTRFFADQAVTHLPLLRDPDQSFSRALGVVGLPSTILIDRDGREVARLTGPAEWDGADAKAMIAGLIAAKN